MAKTSTIMWKKPRWVRGNKLSRCTAVEDQLMLSFTGRVPPIHAPFASAQALASDPCRSLKRSMRTFPSMIGPRCQARGSGGNGKVRTLRQVELVRTQRPQLPQPGKRDCRDP
jgi:hypothetical protein